MASFDGVVIGAGHNGLTLASYLSRAGLKLAVLERNPRIGGGCSTDEPTLPGYRFNLHSNFFMGFRHSPLIRDLDLHRFGFAYIEPPVQQGAAFRDGTCVVIHKDLDKTCASLARFSKRDAETFRALHHLYSEQMRPLFTSLAFNAPLPIDALKDRLSGPQAKEFLSHAQHDLFSVVRKHFDDDRIRTLFTSYMHVITTESVPGAGIVFPLIFANVMEFTLPVGGAASFTDAMRRLIESCGGSVQTGADVKEIVVRNGRASAVRLANGDTVEGKKFVVSAIDAPATMRMAGEERFPEEVRKKLNGWHWGNHSLVTLHLALKEAPVYRAQRFDPDLAQAYNIFFGMDDIDQVRSCFDDCAATAMRRNGTAARPSTPSGCSRCGGTTRAISTTAISGRSSCSRRSTWSGSTPTWCEARCAWAPISPRSSGSTGRTRCSRARAPRSTGSICAAPRPATAAASTGRPATSRPTRSPTTSSSSGRGRACRRRNGGTSASGSRRLAGLDLV
jgi:phytoene dehydrogenase-like protein